MGTSVSAATEPDSQPSPADESVTCHEGTVDRIVDGEHIVCLLEEDGRVVDQVVAPAADHEWAEEGDPIIALTRDGDLVTIRPAPA